MFRSRALAAFLFLAVASASALTAGSRVLDFTDLMQFHQIRQPSVSRDGRFIAYALQKDRGDGQAVIRAVEGAGEHRVERGSAVVISGDSRFAVAVVEPTLQEREAKQGETDSLRNGLAIVTLATGSQEVIDNVKEFALSEDGRWLAYRHDHKVQSRSEEQPEEADEAPGKDAEKKRRDRLGTPLKLRDLRGGTEVSIEHVSAFAFDRSSQWLAYSLSAPEGSGNALRVRRLEGGRVSGLHQAESASYTHLTWARDVSRLAFLAGAFEAEGKHRDAELWTWNAGDSKAVSRVSPADAPDGYTLPPKNRLVWSRDGRRLFFGFKPTGEEALSVEEPTPAEREGQEGPFRPYDLESLVQKRGVDVWHWDDPFINSHQKKRWEREKDRTYSAVVHLDTGTVVPLSDLAMPTLVVPENPHFAVATSNVPYRREVTWNRRLVDLYTVDLVTGKRRLVKQRLPASNPAGNLSPAGGFLTFYEAGHWYLHDVEGNTTRNLTEGLGVSFANEDHDYPGDPPGYGQAEWLGDESAALIYDKYDVWQVFTDDRKPIRLTDGRQREMIFRVVDVEDEIDRIQPGSRLLLSAYHNREKHDSFYAGNLRPDGGLEGLEALYQSKAHRVRFQAKAEDADRLIFTRERYDEFPDLWVSNLEFETPRKLSDANPQLADYAWGGAELVEWTSLDGTPLQGVLIKPGGYQEGKRYPVLVYFYRFFSQRLHEFNEPVVNHRPSFPLYASNGYAVFLPDIRFQIGRPGFSATKCLVPGVQKLVDMGIADPEAIGLHGHSWSGYQTAFVITQTDIFAAAVAGAPVSNMTSAYSGIRWGTGLARQFQYEKTQSRIGGSLWEYPERYIENSPVFFADRIKTPLLIQFGDEDEAVPWYQGIELYLACRRLGKECIFLQYRGEPHHLKKYPNKVDYSIKMKQFFDHHLKGEPAPAWMSQGVPYTGQ